MTTKIPLEVYMDYQAAAAKTSKHVGENNLHPMRRAIAALGLVNEAIEVGDVLAESYANSAKGDFGMIIVDGNRLGKELGDVWWYNAELHTAHCDMSLHESVADDPLAKIDDITHHLVKDGSVRAHAELALYSANQLKHACMIVGEMVKKNLGHDHPVCIEDLGEALDGVTTQLHVIAHLWDLSTERILKDNIEKIRKRFGEKFSAERSLHRAAGDT